MSKRRLPFAKRFNPVVAAGVPATSLLRSTSKRPLFTTFKRVVSCRSSFPEWCAAPLWLVHQSCVIDPSVWNIQRWINHRLRFKATKFSSPPRLLKRSICVTQTGRCRQVWQGSGRWTVRRCSEVARCPDRTERCCCTSAPPTGEYSLRTLEEAGEKRRENMLNFFCCSRFVCFLNNRRNNFWLVRDVFSVLPLQFLPLSKGAFF